jgi:hypothetical protein
MTRAGKYIYAFLENHFGIYDNPQGIQFIMNMDDSVFVVCPIKPPPEPFAEFGLQYASETFDEFVNDFQFSGILALKRLTVDQLWDMYYKGKVELFCNIEVNVIFFELYFRMAKNNAMIVRDEDDREHVLAEVLTTPRQFLDYTQSLFYEAG